MHDQSSMASLQEDERLLIQILVRLPVKSLIRFTCVCKYWLSLIRSPNFVTKHYSTRSNLSEYDSILSVLRQACSISRFNYQDLTFETAFKFRPSVAYYPPRFKIYHRDVITDFNLIGPSNGLFLIELTKNCQVLLLWNPATRELFELPQVPSGCCHNFGFGFDPVTHDYKVVGLYGHSDRFDNTIVWLYSLAANSWKRLFDAYANLTHFCYFTRVESYRHMGPSSTGRMHNWILRDRGFCSQPRNSLLSFDMVDQVFVETPLPADAPTIIHGFMYLGSNRMYPSVYCVGHDLQLHVWDLQQYGPTGVWNKVLNLNLKFPVCGSFSMVLHKNKEFVFSDLDTVSSFDLATQQLNSLGIPADEDILAYTESLVSIASSVRQPPPITMDQSSAETVSLPFVDVDDQQATQIPADDNNLAYTESSVSIARSEFQPSPTINHSSDESVPLQVGDEGDVDDQQATQSIIPDSILRFLKNKECHECQPMMLRIPELTDTERLLLRRRLVRQPPALDYSSDETVQLEDEGPVEGQQESSETTMIHQMQLPNEDDDSDDSSTDSAFITPDITPLLDSSTIYIDYEKDLEFYPLRKNEVERLLKLPYCLHEINKPVIYNPCTF